jgi:hypothetical protein
LVNFPFCLLFFVAYGFAGHMFWTSSSTARDSQAPEANERIGRRGLFRPLATALGNSSDNDGELRGNAGGFAPTSDRDAAGSSLCRAARYRKGG